MKLKALILTGIALAYASPALAHHSFSSMFEAAKNYLIKAADGSRGVA